MAMRIASSMKEMASIWNGRPNTSPYLPVRPGQSRPISNDSTVPVTAPTAKVTAAACDHRRASVSATASFRRRPL
jgi:hypothetical protein